MTHKPCSHPDCDQTATWMMRRSVQDELVSLLNGTEWQKFSHVANFSVTYACDEHKVQP